MFINERKLLARDGQTPSAEELAKVLTQLFEMQQGFQSCLIGDDRGDWRLMSIWRTEENYREFELSAEGAKVAEIVAEAGLGTVHHSHYPNMAMIEPNIGELRLIQATVVPEEIDRVMEYWRETGRELNQSAPGCVRAEAFLDRDESQLHFVIWWRTADDAKHFRYTDHLDGELARGFGTGFRSFGRYSLAPVEL